MNHTSLLSQEERNERKQLEIEQKDERNIALSDAAKARAWEWMVWLYALSICLLALFDVIQLAAFSSCWAFSPSVNAILSLGSGNITKNDSAPTVAQTAPQAAKAAEMA